jgi:hypothetical protein
MMKNKNDQLDLIPRPEFEELFPYWREQLKTWIKDAWYYRHAPFTTGWSMACSGITFAEHLFRCGQMTKTEFRRWFKFHRRIQRWENKYWAEKKSK